MRFATAPVWSSSLGGDLSDYLLNPVGAVCNRTGLELVLGDDPSDYLLNPVGAVCNRTGLELVLGGDPSDYLLNPVGAVCNRTASAQLETLLVPTGSDSSECSPIHRGRQERHRDS